MKQCPFCAEEIQDAAIKCRYCGELLSNPRALNEVGIWQGRPSLANYVFHFLFAILLLPLFGAGLICIPLIFLDQRSKLYTITNKRITEKTGILSRQIREIAMPDVLDIILKQNLVQRLFGLGVVSVSSASTGTIEISFNGIADPFGVKNTISRAKSQTWVQPR